MPEPAKDSILKALAGTTWGQHKETLIVTFKAGIRSLFTYVAPIWFPNAADSNLQKLQRVQNQALRISTGCVRATSESHLHTETKVLPVKEHLSLLGAQHLATCMQQAHPSYATVTADSGPRPMKHTLQTKFGRKIAKYCVGGQVDDLDEARVDLHTEAVRDFIRNRQPNRVLRGPAPDIGDEEELPRHHRTALGQLRSGHCSALAEYKFRVGQAASPTCPSCSRGPQTPEHVFKCPAHPTTLTPRDMWTSPTEVASFLVTLPFFGLAELPRPPPEPPPDAARRRES